MCTAVTTNACALQASQLHPQSVHQNRRGRSPNQRRAAADRRSGHSSRLEAEAASLASEASGFVGELVAKRPRVESDRLDTRPEEARAAAASNRNHDSERRRREANKEWRVEEEALLYEFLQREEELMGVIWVSVLRTTTWPPSMIWATSP